MKNNYNRFLSVAVILLLVTNIVLAGLMIFGKGKKAPPKRQNVFEQVSKEMGLDSVQKRKYDSLREAHFANVGPVLDTIRTVRQSLFNLIQGQEINDSLANHYLDIISQKQMMADRMTLNHLRNVRQMFTPDQQEKYDQFIQKMVQRGRKDSSRKKK
ncbi:MAG: hypothetical protein KDB99_16505 [Chitinophagaceae bacterium]|nr:hypothetical protein [Chitinophagaceae bacterium]MCB9054762.1 hypothetical protein [Chitinophagales bacterium]